MTTMNTGAASLSDEQKKQIAAVVHCDCTLLPGANFYTAAELAIQATLAQISRATPTPQADAAPIISGHEINDLFLKWSEWTTELGEAISRKNIDGFVSELRAAIAAGGAQEPAAARDVLAERRRQMSVEGWTPEHDDEHANGDMALAAACYAASAGGVPWSDDVPSFWPWADKWWKPTTPRRDLVKAGALILAEIERLDRAAASNGEQA